MRRGRNRQDRPPHVGAAVLAKALVGVFIVFLCAGGATAAAGYFQFRDFVDPEPIPGEPTPEPTIDIPDKEVESVKPGGPRTLLLLGSDRRGKLAKDAQLGQEPHSDTIVLIRLDPSRGRVAMLSLPRDLSVTIPGVADGVKINQAYDEGGAGLTLKTVKNLFTTATGEPFKVNGVIDVNFNGFQRAVNYVHGVYVDIDRHYYNPAGSGFAEIDVDAGYQRLVGSDALAYVRYRHTDSDLYRGARQQDFLRQAAQTKDVQELKSLDDAVELVKIFRRYFRFDKNFMRTKNLAGMLKTAIVLASKHAPINQISLQGITESDDPKVDTRLFVSNENIKEAWESLMTGRRATNPKRSDLPTKAPKKSKKGKSTSVAGLINATRLGEDMAVLDAKKLRLPFYFPEQITNRSQYVNGTPRIYKLPDEQGKNHNAYRLVLYQGEPGEYWGVQGMTWKDPPILRSPDRIRTTASGRKLLLFYDGSKIRMIGWKTPRGAYYVTNTIGRKISNARMIEIASSLKRLHS
jgi:LCP family protein required for cell wall assembly